MAHGGAKILHPYCTLSGDRDRPFWGQGSSSPQASPITGPCPQKGTSSAPCKNMCQQTTRQREKQSILHTQQLHRVLADYYGVVNLRAGGRGGLARGCSCWVCAISGALRDQCWISGRL